MTNSAQFSMQSKCVSHICLHQKEIHSKMLTKLYISGGIFRFFFVNLFSKLSKIIIFPFYDGGKKEILF